MPSLEERVTALEDQMRHMLPHNIDVEQLRRTPLAALGYGRTDLPFDLAILGMFGVSAVAFGARAVWGVLHDTSRTRQTRAAIHYSWIFALFAAIVAGGTFHVL